MIGFDQAGHQDICKCRRMRWSGGDILRPMIDTLHADKYQIKCSHCAFTKIRKLCLEFSNGRCRPMYSCIPFDLTTVFVTEFGVIGSSRACFKKCFSLLQHIQSRRGWFLFEIGKAVYLK